MQSLLSPFSVSEIMETIRMLQVENLDIRTVTLGISLQDCACASLEETCRRVYDKITRQAESLVAVCEEVASSYGVRIVNKRVAVTPVAQVGEPSGAASFVPLAQALDRAAGAVGVNYIGGFSALVHKGFSKGDRTLFNSLPEALANTKRVCASVNVAATRAGINMDAIVELGQIIKETARLTATGNGLGCARLVTFCNAPEDNPFMAGAYHGAGEPEAVLNIGISGPGAILAAVRQYPKADLGELASVIKNTAFKVTRLGELVGRQVSERLQIPLGIIDISLAPTNAPDDSVAEILAAIGVERCGGHGTTAALAFLNDAVKKGGSMAVPYVGGLSGTFIPVSEDEGMVRAVQAGALSLAKLEAMTAVCSVGLDMVAIPGDTPAEIIAGIIADEAAIGVINQKTTAVRVIPVPGKNPGDMVEFGGLLGRAPVMAVSKYSPAVMLRRGGRFPAPLQALVN